MKPLHTLCLLLSACLSSAVVADGDWRYRDSARHHSSHYSSHPAPRYYDTHRDQRYERRPHHAAHRHHRDHRVEYIVIERPVHVTPQVIYQEARPRYRETIVYQQAPRYYDAPHPYREPPPPHYRHDSMSPATGQILGAVAGGVIGSRFGQGNGRVAASAAGAFLGSVIGGELARD